MHMNKKQTEMTVAIPAKEIKCRRYTHGDWELIERILNISRHQI